MYKVLGVDQQEYGPVTDQQVRDWIRQRRLNSQSLARRTQPEVEPASWIPLSQFPEFSQDLADVEGPALSGGTNPYAMDHGGYLYPSRTNSMAIAGFIMGLIAATGGLCCCYGFPFNLLGVVFSAIALAQISRDPSEYSGKGLALAGLVLSLLSVALVILMMILSFSMNSSGWKFTYP